PFGTVPGSLITIGDNLIFIDDDHPEASFTVARTDLQNLSVADGIVTVQIAKPVRDRSGERTALSFRLREDTRTVGITNWFGGGTIRIGGGTIPTQAGSVTSKPESADGTTSMSYDAKHKHRLGSCRGRLIVNEKG